MLLEQLTQLSAVDIVQSDATVLTPPLKGIDILKAGTLHFFNADDTEHTVVFPAAADGGCYPYRYWSRINRVMDTGTTLADTEMIGVR